MGLGQTELFEPAPTRRVIRWHGTSWAGVDPSTQRCAIAVIDGDEREVHSVSFPTRGSIAERLAAVHSGVAGLWAKVGAGVGVVIVEQPSGRQPNPALSYAVGATLAAIASVDCLEAPFIETVPSSRWKKVACGHGGISKPKLGSSKEYGVLEWARSVGYEGSSWDEADACGVAEYARRTFALEMR